MNQKIAFGGSSIGGRPIPKCDECRLDDYVMWERDCSIGKNRRGASYKCIRCNRSFFFQYNLWPDVDEMLSELTQEVKKFNIK